MNNETVNEVLETAECAAMNVANSEPSTGRVVGELVIGGTVAGLAIWKGVDLAKMGWKKLKGFIDKRKAKKENVVTDEELETVEE